MMEEKNINNPSEELGDNTGSDMTEEKASNKPKEDGKKENVMAAGQDALSSNPPEEPGQTVDTEPKRKKRRRAIVIVAAVLITLTTALIAVLSYGFAVLSRMHENPEQYQETEVPEATDAPEDIIGLAELTNPEIIQGPNGDVLSDDNILNIMMFGLDTRSQTQLSSGNTDVMIILSLDKVHGKIKMISIMRDILVKTETKKGGSVLVRANTLFGRFGPLKAAQRLGEYFGVKIDHYATVNFACTANIVDILGGVQLNLTDDEIRQINDNLRAELYKSGQHQMTPGAGLRTIDGAQSVAYARIRHLSGADFNRTQRQRNVVNACLKKLPGMTLSRILDLIPPITQNVRTDLTEVDMVNYASALFGLRNEPVSQLRVPIDGTWENESYKGMSILNIDFKKNHDAVQNFIFKDVMIEQSDGS